MGVPILMVGEKMQPNAFKLRMALYMSTGPPSCWGPVCSLAGGTLGLLNKMGTDHAKMKLPINT